jgi:hypothetical protein
LGEDPGFDPLLEATVSRGAGTEAGGVQRVPLTAGAQHEENGVEGATILHAGVVTAQRVRLAGREQRLDLGPECIRDAPKTARVLGLHPSSSCGMSLLLQEGFDISGRLSYRDRL